MDDGDRPDRLTARDGSHGPGVALPADLRIAEERPDSPDAIALIAELEAHLAPQYPAASRHGFSVRRLLDEGVRFVVARIGDDPAGCGGILLVPDADPAYGELKRMYVRPTFRGRRIGEAVIETLADIATAEGIDVLRLETGIHQTAAIRLYERVGFTPIGPFGPYRPDPQARFLQRRRGPA